MTLAGFTGIGRLDNVQGCKAHMCVQKRGCGEAACGNKGEPWQNHSWVIACLTASHTASQFSVMYTWGIFPGASPSHTCRFRSGLGLKELQCSWWLHRLRGLYGRSLWGRIHQNCIRLHPYNEYSLGHTKYLRGSVLFFAQGRCQEKSCTDSLT